MSRLMSVAMTEAAVVDRTKTVTRRANWWMDVRGRPIIRRGAHLTLCRKVQGRKPGEPIVRLAEVEVVDIRREVLSSITQAEVAREGFPDMDRADFINRFFVEAQGIYPHHYVTRIEWRYLEGDPA